MQKANALLILRGFQDDKPFRSDQIYSFPQKFDQFESNLITMR